MKQSPAKVLDIGFGTALLTSKLYDTGNDVTGIDFSAEMLKIATSKMPKANLMQWDFSSGTLPDFNSQPCELTFHEFSFCSGVIEIRKNNT